MSKGKLSRRKESNKKMLKTGKKSQLKNKKVRHNKQNNKSVQYKSRRKLHYISARVHPNSKRYYQKVRRISPHRHEVRKTGPVTFSEEQINLVGGGKMMTAIRSLFNKDLKKIRNAITASDKLKKTTKDMNKLTGKFTRSVTEYSIQVEEAINLANQFVNQYRKYVIFEIISKHYKSKDKKQSPLHSVLQGGIVNEALSKMEDTYSLVDRIKKQLIAIYTKVDGQRKIILKQHNDYKNACKKYLDKSAEFNKIAIGTITHFETEKKTMDKFEAELQNPDFKQNDPSGYKETKNRVSKFKKIKDQVEILLTKDKEFQASVQKVKDALVVSKNEVLYLDEQFDHIEKLRNDFLTNTNKSSGYIPMMEKMFKEMIKVNLDGDNGIKKNLESVVKELKRVHSLLEQEKREYMKYLIDAIINLKTIVDNYAKYEASILKIAETSIQKFLQQEQSITFVYDFQVIYEIRSLLSQKLTNIEFHIKDIGKVLQIVHKYKKETVLKYFGDLIARGYKKEHPLTIEAKPVKNLTHQQQGQQQGQKQGQPVGPGTAPS